jgi:hypothetical protein
MIKIIQTSAPRTGSTLLLNLIHGFLAPKEEIHWSVKTKIHEFLITKTHDTDIDKLINTYKEYELYFIVSERNNIISELIKYKKYSNVLVINYNEINETKNLLLENIIDNIFLKFKKFLPKEIVPDKSDIEIKKDMLTRIRNMNKLTEEIKNKPFSYWDKFYGIHGHHRNN